MKKTYKIEVDCANCANLMEEAARKTAGVQTATVNFMTQKMIVEFAEGHDKAYNALLRPGRFRQGGSDDAQFCLIGRDDIHAAQDIVRNGSRRSRVQNDGLAHGL